MDSWDQNIPRIHKTGEKTHNTSRFFVFDPAQKINLT